VIRVGVRLLLLSGAAASLALATRDRLAASVVRRLDKPVHAIALAAREIAPRPRATTSVPGTPQPFEPFVLPAESPRAVVVVPKTSAVAKHKPNPTPVQHTITKKQLDDAIEHRLGGATAVLVKGDDGKPAGLKLGGVSQLASFGIRDGDVLVSANGLPLRNANEALAALGALKDATRVVVVLRRGSLEYSVPVTLTD